MIEIVRALYDRLNKNDLQGCLELFDVKAGRIEFEGTPMAGTFRGIKEVYENFHKGRNNWAEGGCFPEEFFVHGNKVVVLVHVHVKVIDQDKWIDGRVADGFEFKDEKIVQMNSYMKKDEAFQWAGIESK